MHTNALGGRFCCYYERKTETEASKKGKKEFTCKECRSVSLQKLWLSKYKHKDLKGYNLESDRGDPVCISVQGGTATTGSHDYPVLQGQDVSSDSSIAKVRDKIVLFFFFRKGVYGTYSRCYYFGDHRKSG